MFSHLSLICLCLGIYFSLSSFLCVLLLEFQFCLWKIIWCFNLCFLILYSVFFFFFPLFKQNICVLTYIISIHSSVDSMILFLTMSSLLISHFFLLLPLIFIFKILLNFSTFYFYAGIPICFLMFSAFYTRCPNILIIV